MYKLGSEKWYDPSKPPIIVIEERAAIKFGGMFSSVNR